MLTILLQVGLCLICMTGFLCCTLVVMPLAIPLSLQRALLLLVKGLRAVFGGLGMHVVTGHRFLGGFIGSLSARYDYVLSKVHRWAGHINV